MLVVIISSYKHYWGVPALNLNESFVMRGNYQSPGAAGRMLRQVIGYGFPEHNQPNRRANLRRCCCSPNQFNEEPPLARKKSIRVDINVNININVNGRSNKKGEHHDHRNETSFRPGT